MNLAVKAVCLVILGTEEVLRFEVMRSIECLIEWNQELVLVLLGYTTGCLFVRQKGAPWPKNDTRRSQGNLTRGFSGASVGSLRDF